MSQQQQRRTDPRWTPQDLPEQPSYRNTAPGWGQVRHTLNCGADVAHGVIHTIEHSTLLQVVRSSRAIPAQLDAASATPAPPAPPPILTAAEWAEDAARLAALVDGAIRNLLPITGNPTIARLRSYLADLKSRLLAYDPPGVFGAVQCITAALSAPGAVGAHGKANSAGDISSLDALAQAAIRLLQRAGYQPGRAPKRPTNPRVRQFRGE